MPRPRTFIGTQLINKLLPRIFRMNIRPTRDTGRPTGGTTTLAFFAPTRVMFPARAVKPEPQRRRLKEQTCILQPRHHREHGQDDGTAPRNPTQLINTRSRRLKPGTVAIRQIPKEDGRRKSSMRQNERRNGNRQQIAWVNQQPSTRNMAICASQARPSKFCRIRSGCESADYPAENRTDKQPDTATFQRRG